MSSLPRRAVTRTAKLASLPLSVAGRVALGAGKRLGGAPAEAVSAAVAERTAAQVFSVLGELKGGAMKAGQTMSIMEAGLPEDLARPYRDALTRLQEAAPPLPPGTVHQVLASELGPRWRTRFRSFDDEPAAAASIGQVHKAIWKDGRQVAVKVQYPGAGEALRSDLRQLRRLARMSSGLIPGVEIEPLLDRLIATVSRELDYEQEARNQVRFGERFAGDPRFVIPAVVHRRGGVLVTEWLEGIPLSRIIAGGTSEQRSQAAERYVEFLISSPQRAGLLHADPHPGNFRLMDGGRLGVLDFGAVDELPGGLPPAMGELLAAALDGRGDQLRAGLIAEGFLPAGTTLTGAEIIAFVSPYIDCLRVAEYRYDRAWMREQFARFTGPQATAWRTSAHFNLPPSYLFIDRVWIGGVGVLCQLGGTIPARDIIRRWVPGFTGPD